MTSINTRSTKAQLCAHIAAQDQALRLHANTIQALRLELSIAKVSAPVPPAPTVRAPYVPRERNTSLPAHFAAAREAAMRMGRTVKVGA